MNKKNILTSYVEGITNTVHGESYSRIVRYFIPEFITNLIVYSMPLWLDAIFIASLKSTSTYATLGATNNIIHLGIKVAEALSVSTVVLSGYYNGQKDYQKVGDTVRDSFWITCLFGIFFFIVLYFYGQQIYHWYGVSPEIAALGVPYLRIRALGVLFMFIYFAFVGFLRGIKNTTSPMKIFIFGALVFVITDYVLIFGKYGFTAYGLQGSAMATLLQYVTMTIVAVCYVLFNRKNRKYGVNLFSIFTSHHQIKRFMHVSWPIVLDKATLAIAYIWLGKMIAPLGTNAIAAFSAIKDMERFAFLPAIACAHVITFLVSNNIGAQDITAVKINIKKVLLLAGAMVSSILFLMTMFTSQVLYLFDKQGDFTILVMQVFPVISVLVLFDLLQLVLSGALRGTGNVHTVMMVRLVVVFLFFIPISYIFARYIDVSESWRIILIYGSFYIGNAIMSIFYVQRFRSNQWKNLTI